VLALLIIADGGVMRTSLCQVTPFEALPAWAQALDTAIVEEIVSRFASTFVRARKP
jgi:hypothetical protein